VAVVLTLVRNTNKYTLTKQYKNTVQTIQNTVNTSTHITKTPHNCQNTHTYNPHITNPIHTHTHTLQNPHIPTPTYYKTKQPQYKLPNKIVTIQSSTLSIRSP